MNSRDYIQCFPNDARNVVQRDIHLMKYLKLNNLLNEHNELALNNVEWLFDLRRKKLIDPHKRMDFYDPLCVTDVKMKLNNRIKKCLPSRSYELGSFLRKARYKPYVNVFREIFNANPSNRNDEIKQTMDTRQHEIMLKIQHLIEFGNKTNHEEIQRLIDELDEIEQKQKLAQGECNISANTRNNKAILDDDTNNNHSAPIISNALPDPVLNSDTISNIAVDGNNWSHRGKEMELAPSIEIIRTNRKRKRSVAFDDIDYPSNTTNNKRRQLNKIVDPNEMKIEEQLIGVRKQMKQKKIDTEEAAFKKHIVDVVHGLLQDMQHKVMNIQQRMEIKDKQKWQQLFKLLKSINVNACVLTNQLKMTAKFDDNPNNHNTSDCNLHLMTPPAIDRNINHNDGNNVCNDNISNINGFYYDNNVINNKVPSRYVIFF